MFLLFSDDLPQGDGIAVARASLFVMPFYIAHQFYLLWRETRKKK
jgi:hypothetical protein